MSLGMFLISTLLDMQELAGPNMSRLLRGLLLVKRLGAASSQSSAKEGTDCSQLYK